MVPFWGCDTLRGSSRASKTKVLFLTHLQQLKGYLAFTDLIMIKNQSIGVVEGVLLTSVWILE